MTIKISGSGFPTKASDQFKERKDELAKIASADVHPTRPANARALR